jgi:hypothetical protein
MKNDKGDFFLKSDCLKRVVTLGCHHKVGGDDSHRFAYEAIYDFAEKAELKGIRGTPFALIAATTKQMESNITFKGKVEITEEIKAHAFVSQKFNKNLKFNASEEINLSSMYADASKHNYKFGLSATWSM